MLKEDSLLRIESQSFSLDMHLLCSLEYFVVCQTSIRTVGRATVLDDSS